MKKNLKKITNEVSNPKGTALIEILVAVTILTMIIAPFLVTHLQASKNNQEAKKEILSMNLAQEVMEEIKTKSAFLNIESGAGDYKEYINRGGYIAKYKILKEESILNINEVSDFNDISEENFILDFFVDGASLKFNNFDYDLLNGLIPIHYYLEISGDGVAYSYLFYSDTNTNIFSETIEDKDVFKLKIKYLNNSNQLLNFHLNLDDLDKDLADGLRKNVFCYIIDDNSGAVTMFNDGDLAFKKYYQITSEPKEYTNFLYKIEVLVEKDGEELNKIISYVKK